MSIESGARRRLNATVQVNLRIKEGLRRRLLREAKLHGVSLNREMRDRLASTFGAPKTETAAWEVGT
jgi:predicted HicB family RNase H-like nuclease